MFKPYNTQFAGYVYLRATLLRSFSFHVFSKPTNDPIESAAYNSLNPQACKTANGLTLTIN